MGLSSSGCWARPRNSIGRVGCPTPSRSTCRYFGINPDQFEAMHLLGVLRGQQGRYREALDLIGAALTVRSDAAEARQNYGLILHKMTRHQEALAVFDQLLAVRPDAFEALGNRGNVLCALGRHCDALVSYDRALAIRPNYPEALNNRGNALCVLGRYEEALASYSRALAYRPGDAETLHNRGNALRALKRYEEALASFDRALAASPDFADALSDRGGLLQELGRHDEALACYETALAAKPDHADAILGFAAILIARGQAGGALNMVIRALEIDETIECKTLFVECVKDLEPAGDVGELKRLVLRAMLEPWTRPSTLSAVCARLIKIEGGIRESMARAACAWPKLLPAGELLGPRGLERISGDRLLECLLVTTPVTDIELERFLTAVRCSMLDAAEAAVASAAVDAAVLSFCCALARQCFINDYVFACADAELERARRLGDKMVTALAAGAPLSALWPAAVAAYFPLGELPGAQTLRAGDWPDAVTGLLVQQVEEPRRVRECAAFIPRLTAIADGASFEVRRQYEENPYPRWVTMGPPGRRTTVGTYLQGLFPLAPIDGLDESRGVDILVAGCGTGQHSIGTAQQYLGSRVLAIDLSLASLCYAKFKTDGFGRRQYRIRASRYPGARIGRSDVRSHRGKRCAAPSRRPVAGVAHAAIATPPQWRHENWALQRAGTPGHCGGANVHCGAGLSPDGGGHSAMPSGADELCGWNATEECRCRRLLHHQRLSRSVVSCSGASFHAGRHQRLSRRERFDAAGLRPQRSYPAAIPDEVPRRPFDDGAWPLAGFRKREPRNLPGDVPVLGAKEDSAGRRSRPDGLEHLAGGREVASGIVAPMAVC